MRTIKFDSCEVVSEGDYVVATGPQEGSTEIVRVEIPKKLIQAMQKAQAKEEKAEETAKETSKQTAADEKKADADNKRYSQRGRE